MRYLFPLVLFLSVACSSKDQKMCDCLKVSEELNQLSSDVIDNGATNDKAKEIKKLYDKKDSLCVDFQSMSGPEMLKKKQACQE